MSKAMSLAELREVLLYIEQFSGFDKPIGYGRTIIKYVYPSFDMRTKSIFSVTLSGYGGDDIVFHTQNECRNLPLSLKERIMTFIRFGNKDGELL